MRDLSLDTPMPIVWSVAGTDSGGGAGLAADLRAADALGVHLCTVVAAVTAQNSQAVHQVQAVPPAWLDQQLAALADDMPPRAIKTGLLGSADNVRVLVRWLDRLRQRQPVALVVDPVLRASTGAALADDALRAAYRELLLPRASVITPNRAEAAALLGHPAALSDGPGAVPAWAQALRGWGAEAVCITGGDADGALASDWLATPQAQGWLSLPRLPVRHHHGTGCTFASALAAALALGHGAADAAVLAKLATAGALRAGRPAGAGAGPVRAAAGFARPPALLPQLSLDDQPPQWADRPATAAAAPGLYAIVDSAERVAAVLAAGADTVQLRIKQGPPALLRQEIAAAVASARRAGRPLFVNDHAALAMACGAHGVHLGQEDLLALAPAERARLRASGLALGLSSHSLWELCRAAAWQPAYLACGPVWPTTTKQMPWQAQGLDNLGWWCALSPAPVVAIGGLLQPDQVAAVAEAGAAGACVVRGLGQQPANTLPALAAAWQRGRAAALHRPLPAPPLPHPCL